MDEVDITLSSPDEHAVVQIQHEIRARIAGVRFGRVFVGRSGDWICRGSIDLAVPGGQQRLRTWVKAYASLRQSLADEIGRSDDMLLDLDDLMERIAAAVLPKGDRR